MEEDILSDPSEDTLNQLHGYLQNKQQSEECEKVSDALFTASSNEDDSQHSVLSDGSVASAKVLTESIGPFQDIRNKFVDPEEYAPGIIVNHPTGTDTCLCEDECNLSSANAFTVQHTDHDQTEHDHLPVDCELVNTFHIIPPPLDQRRKRGKKDLRN